MGTARCRQRVLGIGGALIAVGALGGSGALSPAARAAYSLPKWSGCFAGPPHAPGATPGVCSRDDGEAVPPVWMSLDWRDNGSSFHPYIDIFTMTLKCLGTADGRTNFLQLLKPVWINAAGHFSYHGTVRNGIPWTPSHPSDIRTPITLTGRFTGPRTADVTLSVHFRACHTMHLQLRQQGRTAHRRRRVGTR
jgi:hypothetical protein